MIETNLLNNPLVIICPPRSGSSLLTNILSNMGLYCGENVKSADENNKNGYYENVEVRELLISYLRENDTEKLFKKYHPLNLNSSMDGFREGVNKVFGEKRWVFKDPKSAFCWRLWSKEFPEVVFVICRRNRADVLSSIKRTPFMDAYQTDDGWEALLDIYDELIKQIMENGHRYVVVDIDKILSGDFSELKLICSLLNIPYNEEALSCINKNYWHGEKNDGKEKNKHDKTEKAKNVKKTR